MQPTLEVLSSGAGTPPRAGWRPRSAPALAAAAALALVAAAAWGPWSERRAIRALPAAQRSALLAHAVDELRRTCGEGRPEVLAPHCRELAALAERFDECTGECAALARAVLLPVPSR